MTQKFFKDKGIILKRVNIGEADKILTIFTEHHGKIQTKAKGIRWIKSKFAGHLELFTYARLSLVEGKSLYIITESEGIESFQNIRRSLKKTYLTYYFSDLVSHLSASDDVNSELFSLFLEVLRQLHSSNFNRKLSLLRQFFEVKALYLSGFPVQVYDCASCGRKLEPSKNYFSNKLGGVVCYKCKSEDKLSYGLQDEVVKLLRILQVKDFNFLKRLKVSQKTAKETSRVIKNFLRFVLEKDLDSSLFLERKELAFIL
ncbi:DNA repair protein RecO [bacterium (Candidatus Torokbacteria) CG_4_10_14_0_2_um_filter_35_8]|nr:MAG: DNA repair protein RecO [bacterium (Candidatus Torokbacteria) CG_4_10_14_0_2_um_filter_35_8]